MKIDFTEKLFIYRMPFSWKTPFTYLLTLIFEIIMDFIVVSIYIPNVTYFIGSCFFLIFIFDIDSPILHASIVKPYANDGRQLKANFINIIHFYSDAKGLS